MIQTVAIVGGGLAGAVVAQTLRAEGYDGEVLVFGAEPYSPYDRPSLSKSALLNEQQLPTDIFKSNWAEINQICFQPGVVVEKIDPEVGIITLDTGSSVHADRIVLCTGSRPRKINLTGSNLAGVHYLRTWEDTIKLRAQIKPGIRLSIIGGGLIGCELATTARAQGADVCILESGTELLERALGSTIGAYCREELEKLGVKVYLHSQASLIEGTDCVCALHTKSGQRIESDLVLICIGGEAVQELAVAAGLRCLFDGVAVDEVGMTSHTSIYAAGDLACWPLLTGGKRRLETYLNSQSQAETVAKAILGKAKPAPQIPRSWTEIAGHRFQMIGDIDGSGQIIIRQKSTGSPSLYFRVDESGCLQAAISIDSPAEFASAVRLVEKRCSPDLHQLANPAFSLRELVRAIT